MPCHRCHGAGVLILPAFSRLCPECQGKPVKVELAATEPARQPGADIEAMLAALRGVVEGLERMIAARQAASPPAP